MRGSDGVGAKMDSMELEREKGLPSNKTLNPNRHRLNPNWCILIPSLNPKHHTQNLASTLVLNPFLNSNI